MAGSTYNVDLLTADGSKVVQAGEIQYLDAANQPGYGMPRYYEYGITFQTAGLATGVTLYTPAVGDYIYDIGVVITTAFNGTTPKIDVGTFTSTTGLFAQTASAAIDATKLYADVTSNTGLSVPNFHLWLSSGVIEKGRAGASVIPSWQVRVTAASPLKVVASQNGQINGTAIDSSAGVAKIVVVASSPYVLA